MDEENKRLTKMLDAMYASYTDLHSRFLSLASSSPSPREASPGRKRKVDGLDVIGVDDKPNGRTSELIESSPSDDSCKRWREEPKSKVTKVYVRTDPADSSLVSGKLSCVARKIAHLFNKFAHQIEENCVNLYSDQFFFVCVHILRWLKMGTNGENMGKRWLEITLLLEPTLDALLHHHVLLKRR